MPHVQGLRVESVAPNTHALTHTHTHTHTHYPTNPHTLPGDLLGRALDITVPGSLTGQAPTKHSFTFDKVFGPSADQGAVFEEISELIQSALDGHKVRMCVGCLWCVGLVGGGAAVLAVGWRQWLTQAGWHATRLSSRASP
jgi:hypothetical protein